MNRRRFLHRLGLAPFAAGLAGPLFGGAVLPVSQSRSKTLVLVELKGGNDSLNTVIPHRDPLYKQLRPTLAIGSDQVLPLDDNLGLHPALPTLKRLFDKGEVAIMQNVGYERPNFSHFSSIDIWESASHRTGRDGWLYQLFEKNPEIAGVADAIVLSGSSGFFQGENAKFLVMKSTEEFIRGSKKLSLSEPQSSNNNAVIAHLNRNKRTILRTSSVLAQALESASPITVAFPDTDIGKQFSSAAQIINAGFGVPVIKLSLRGFDTHVDQREAHAILLTELDDALNSFEQALQKQGLWQDVLLMSYSEFGRRAKENGNAGTDHGAAGCHFVIGSQCKGGLFGEAARLHQLEADNVIHQFDFRQLYTTLETRWFGVESHVVDSRAYRGIDFLKSG